MTIAALCDVGLNRNHNVTNVRRESKIMEAWESTRLMLAGAVLKVQYNYTICLMCNETIINLNV